MQTLLVERTAPQSAGEPAAKGHPGLAAAPTLVALVLLFIAVWANGAFALRSWGPLAIFALLALATGRRNGVRGPALAMAGAVWALALWTVLSLAWSDRPGVGVEGAGRALLYAALVSLPLLTLPSRRWAVRTAQLLTAGAAGLVALSFVALSSVGVDWFLAGRLNEPVGYRNGTAALFALCFWLLLAVAAHRRGHPAVRAGAFALGVCALALSLMTQSRGLLIGLASGGAVLVAMGPDRVRRAWVAILAVCAVVIASGDLTAAWDRFAVTGTTVPSAVGVATATLHSLAVATAIGALVLALLDGGLRISERHQRPVRAVAGTILAVLMLAVVGVGALAMGNPVDYAGEKAHEFKQLDATAAGDTRFLTTGGQRYDLWRIAWREFESAPLVGTGEGGYATRYYRERATERNLSDPHSLPLRTLAELGLVGALLLGTFLVAAGVALVRGWPRASVAERRWASALAAAGAGAIGQSTVDWLPLIPGLTGLGLVCLATAVAIVALPPGGTESLAAARSRRWNLARAVPVLAAVLVSLVYLSDTYVRTARADVGASAGQRLAAARTAERLNPWATAPRYLQAGALEELGRRDEAREQLLDATKVERDSFVAIGLLGDLEMRAGNRRAARGLYRRALRLNPRDTGLQRLAR